MRDSDTPNVDVLIVTALQLERAAVRRHLVDLSAVRADGIVADSGHFPVGPANLTVMVVETGAGNISAALAVQRAESAWQPARVIMTGIAGGIKDVAIGDVVASSKVYWVEGGKEGSGVRPRPDHAPISAELIQLARTVATDGRWLARADATGGGDWPEAGRRPVALVGPVAVGERVLADRAGRTAQLITDSYGDSLCVAMEDFGALRAAASRERAQTLAVRGVSDLLHGKGTTDALGAQPLAAANAAAFVFDLLALNAELTPNALPTASSGLLDLAVNLYPQGPLQDAIWERAGGDVCQLDLSGNGRTQWWYAIRLLQHGGGNVDADDLLRMFAEDYPRHPALSMLGR